MSVRCVARRKKSGAHFSAKKVAVSISEKAMIICTARLNNLKCHSASTEAVCLRELSVRIFVGGSA